MGRFHRLVLLAAIAAAPASASADVFKLYGEVQGGGMYGKGTQGDQKAKSFFGQAKGGAYGAQVGAEFLIFDGHVSHRQYVNGDGLKTWTQFGVGLHFGMDTGSEQDKKVGKGGYLSANAGIAFGIGTGAQVMPPLDNAQLTDKAFLLEGRLDFGKHLNKVFDLGIAVPVSYGYFFKSGNGATANDLSTHYQGVQVEALLVLRANIRFL
jgi:hypothetical protein